MRQQLQAVGGTGWPQAPNWPAAIGDAYGGGFFAGQINVSGTKYNLVIAPKATEYSSQTWGAYGVSTGYTSPITGPVNSAGEAGYGYQASSVCESLNYGGYTDWYLPARNELEVVYYYLKSYANTNFTGQGANANAVSPEPVSQNYTSGSPAQTSVALFQSGGLQAFQFGEYWSSTENNANTAIGIRMYDGYQFQGAKNSGIYVRAIRRVLA
jgi:hypothetical protein